jgi:hypothetical protein
VDIFHIDWKGTYPLDNAVSQPEAREAGVYAIYQSESKEIEYGWSSKTKKTRKLRYIGKSKEIARRVHEHKQGFAHIGNEEQLKKCSVCFGIIHWYKSSHSVSIISPRQLRDIENFLIISLKPQGNSEITKQRYKGIDIMIINTGKTGSFNKVMCSNPELVTFLKSNLASTKKPKSDSW